MDYTDLRTVKQLAQEAPFVTESTLRWWIYHANSNGFDTVLIKIGGRVYIDKRAFNKWLEGQTLGCPGQRSCLANSPNLLDGSPARDGGASFVYSLTNL